MLTRQQRYELYHCGVDRMLNFVEQLLSHLAEVERHVGPLNFTASVDSGLAVVDC